MGGAKKHLHLQKAEKKKGQSRNYCLYACLCIFYNIALLMVSLVISRAWNPVVMITRYANIFDGLESVDSITRHNK
jgi:hypothetical protein